MSDPVFKIVLQGVDAGASSTVDKMVDKLNKAKETTKKWNDERAKMAREDRAFKFRQLSDEDKLIRLKERQLQIEQRLERATSSGNTTRMTALKLAQARNKAAIGSASGSSGEGGFFATATSLRGGIIGGIAAAISGAYSSSLSFADNMSDLADQLNITRKQVVEITRAAGYAGVSTKQIVGNLTSLEAARSAALGGDQKMKALFSQFGINPAEGNVVDIAQSLKYSLGRSGGISTENRNAIGKLVGRKPESFVAMLRSMEDAGGDIEQTLSRLDLANSRNEQFWNKVKEFTATTFAGILGVVDNYNRYSSDPRTGAPGSLNGIDYVQRKIALQRGFGPNSNQRPSTMADLHRLEDARLNAMNVYGQVQDPTFRTPVPQADALARMGLYVGGGPNSANSVLRQQLNELKLIKDATRSSSQAIRNL